MSVATTPVSPGSPVMTGMATTREAGDSATATSPSATGGGGAGGSGTRVNGSAGMTAATVAAGAVSTMPTGGKAGDMIRAGTGTGIPGVRDGVMSIATLIVVVGAMTEASNAMTPTVDVASTGTTAPAATGAPPGDTMTVPVVAANTSPVASTAAETMSPTTSRIPVWTR